MIKRTLFFANTVSLTLKNKQLIIVNKETQAETSVPIEDIGFVVIENNQIYIFIPVINELAAHNAAVIFCNDKHLPFTMNLHIKRIKSWLPREGSVSILRFTDKQFSDIISYVGTVPKAKEKIPLQLELF